MDAEYGILAVIFAREKHSRLEIFKPVGKLIESPDNGICLVFVIKFFCYLDEIRQLLCAARQFFKFT
jgi:hypothetical protein